MPNTLILYDGKMSSTERVAEGLGQVIGHVRICEISEGPERLDDYEGVCFVFNFYGALTAGKTKVYLEERRHVLKEKRLAFLGLGFTDNGFTKYCVDMEDLIGGVSITAMFIRNERQTAEAAFQIARRMQAPLVRCDELSLMERIEDFIMGHRTLGLAVSSEGFVRMTPLDYLYIDGEFYIITEGGLKFRGLILSESVSCAIYDTGERGGEVESLQMQAKASILERGGEDYWRILALKGMSPEKMASMPVTLFVVKITPQQYAFLSPAFKEAGMDLWQTLDTTFRRRRWEAGLARVAREAGNDSNAPAADKAAADSSSDQPESSGDRDAAMKERLARAAKEADTAMSAAILNRRESDAAASNARADMENRIESLVSRETTAQLAHEASMMVQEKKTLAETEEELARAASELVREKALAPEEALEVEEVTVAEPDPVRDQEDLEKLAALIAQASENEAAEEEDDDDVVVDAFFEPADEASDSAAAGENEGPAKTDAEINTEAEGLETDSVPETGQESAEEAGDDGEAGAGPAPTAEKEPDAPVLNRPELRVSKKNTFKMPAFLRSFAEPPRVELPEAEAEEAAHEAPAAEIAADENEAAAESVADVTEAAAGETAAHEAPAAEIAADENEAAAESVADVTEAAAGETTAHEAAAETAISDEENRAAGEDETGGLAAVSELTENAGEDAALTGDDSVSEPENLLDLAVMVSETSETLSLAENKAEPTESDGEPGALREQAEAGPETPAPQAGMKAPACLPDPAEAVTEAAGEAPGDLPDLAEAMTEAAGEAPGDLQNLAEAMTEEALHELPDVTEKDAEELDESDLANQAEVDMSALTPALEYFADQAVSAGADETEDDEVSAFSGEEEEEKTDISELLRLMDDGYEPEDEDEPLEEEDAPSHHRRSGGNKERKGSIFGTLLSRGSEFLKSLTEDRDEDDEDDEILDGVIDDPEESEPDLETEDNTDDQFLSEAKQVRKTEAEPAALEEKTEAFDDGEEEVNPGEAETDRPAAEQERRGMNLGGFFRDRVKIGGLFQDLMYDEDEDDYDDLDEEEESYPEAFGVDREEEARHEAEIFDIDEKEEKKFLFSGLRRRRKEESDPDFEAIMDAREELLPDDGAEKNGFFGKALGRMSRFLGFDESEYDEDDAFYDEDDDD